MTQEVICSEFTERCWLVTFCISICKWNIDKWRVQILTAHANDYFSPRMNNKHIKQHQTLLHSLSPERTNMNFSLNTSKLVKYLSNSLTICCTKSKTSLVHGCRDSSVFEYCASRILATSGPCGTIWNISSSNSFSLRKVKIWHVLMFDMPEIR